MSSCVRWLAVTREPRTSRLRKYLDDSQGAVEFRASCRQEAERLLKAARLPSHVFVVSAMEFELLAHEPEPEPTGQPVPFPRMRTHRNA